MMRGFAAGGGSDVVTEGVVVLVPERDGMLPALLGAVSAFGVPVVDCAEPGVVALPGPVV